MGDGNTLAGQLRALLAAKQQKWPERVVVRKGERFEMVSVDLIDWIESANNYAQLHCGSKRRLLNETLTSLEERFDPGRFVRIHRSGSSISRASRSYTHCLVEPTRSNFEKAHGLRLADSTGKPFMPSSRTGPGSLPAYRFGNHNALSRSMRILEKGCALDPNGSS